MMWGLMEDQKLVTGQRNQGLGPLVLVVCFLIFENFYWLYKKVMAMKTKKSIYQIFIIFISKPAIFST